MILKYKDKILEGQLSKLLDEKFKHLNNTESQDDVLHLLKDLRYKTIDKKVLDKLFKYFKGEDYMIDDANKDNKEDKFHSDWYQGSPYHTFMEFFTRKLTDKKIKEIQKNVENCELILSNECYVESIDKMSNTKNILRLKKKTPNTVLKDLKDLDIDATEYMYIDMKLLCSYYHRIHSPMNCKIIRIIPVEGDDDFFGKNSLSILELDINKKHPLYLLLVGESTIQDFDFLVEAGDQLDIFQTIGYFNWGSQTVILYHPDDFKGKEIQIKGDFEYHFVGDCVFKKDKNK